MDSIPEQPSPDLAAVFSKPADVEPNPAAIITPDDPVRRAILVLRAFGDLDQDQVRRVLPMWRHYVTLTPAEMIEIVNAFPSGGDEDDDTPQPGVAMPGGGWISGPMQGGEG